MEKFICPVCGCRTLEEQGKYEICPVCFWEDGRVRDENEPDDANNGMTIAGAREGFLKFGAFREEYRSKTRPPEDSEITDTYLRLIKNKSEE